ncbi:hypothetical protein ZOD2009_15201 [Haladaptatus paucihalophilus DX253]|uniref:DUF7344 domain-containing protein n=1 Tax=Haladaptatus paucihalophilus DX253 TaxID=797209 RepID=E7QW52_HALPU|nr:MULTISPECIES: hypothetical protein [Haladaptatus]EFW91186.1 hypothetical protein ZOD2009_15201 [Haladaptatus paucihalophilus DX253]GKZ16346.1 hypothetical protein HAL_42270 [Haladaptatus sp. T7]SHL64682.1 hypothetical protein SAMN05444342_4314 [Haladaptatus paucihalophilus DX253]
MSATTQQVEEQSNSTDMSTSVELSEDQIYHLLQNERRRNVLRYLHDTEGQVSMRDIAEQVAAWENDSTVQSITSSERQRVYIPLYQSHLPKLDEEGVIEYDQSRGTVTKTETANVLYEYLEPTTTDDTTDNESDDEPTRWERYYLGASGLGATLLAGSTLGFSPFALLPHGSIGLAILGMFWTLTLGQRLA